MKNRFRLLASFFAFVGFGSVIFAQPNDYFLKYPGGFTESFYEIKTIDLDNPISLSWRIETLDGDTLRVATTNEVVAKPQDLELGVLNGIAQAQLIIQDGAVRALLENRSSIIPETVFIVPGGASFTTASEELINGVRVVCGVLESEDEPEKRTILAITSDPTLPFPPLIQLDEARSAGAGLDDPLPFCTSLLPLLSASAGKFSTTFRLLLTEFQRRE